MTEEDNLLKWFEELYDSYGNAIFRHLYLRLGDRERAKELTQDVFMKAWQQAVSGKGIENEKAWLYRVAHNIFINEIRTDKRTFSLDTMIEDVGYDIKDDKSDSTDFALQSELFRYMEDLKESYRTVLVMRYIDGLSISEISSLINESETNVSMRIKRALDKLKQQYEKTDNNED